MDSWEPGRALCHYVLVGQCFGHQTEATVFKQAIPLPRGLQVLGSIYIPEVNYIMMILTVVVVAVFKDAIQLGNAYGEQPLPQSLLVNMGSIASPQDVTAGAVPFPIDQYSVASPCLGLLQCT